jgi:probable HAF family extracellular repeat protein
MRDLGVLAPWTCGDFPDCSRASATDINESGQIVGTSTDSIGKDHFVLWESHTIRDLGLARTYYAWPTRVLINDRGQIAATAGGRAFFWSGGVWQPLGSLGGATDVSALNENGEIVGTSITATGEPHVFVWSQVRGMVDLGTGPHGFSAAWVVDINSRGDILGFAAPCDRNEWTGVCDYPHQARAILWRKR